MVLDSDFRLTLANAGAERIVGHVARSSSSGKPLAELPRGWASPSRRSAPRSTSRRPPARPAGSASSCCSATRRVGRRGQRCGPDAGSEQTLLARGSILPERRVGYVIVFDDISEVISAQRAVAWAEVARRLAHEIMNPLTPIQLAAERMQLKLTDKLPTRTPSCSRRTRRPSSTRSRRSS